MRKIEAHPDAAIFPMMSSDELSDLAEDIKANGLKHDIVLGKLGEKEVIIDGRNRFAACEMANVEPKFQMINGEDVKAFIISNNITRRHLNSGQRAMAMAMMYPEPGKVGRKPNGLAAKPLEVDKGSLSQARTVLNDSRALAEEVMAGDKFLDAAYLMAKARQDANKAEEEKRERVAKGASDLYQLVQDNRMTLADAMAALNERDRKAKEIAQQGHQAAQELSNLISYVASIAMAFQQGERQMLNTKKFPAVVDAMNHLIKLHKEGA